MSYTKPTLQILQYNVHKSKDKVMEPLFQDHALQKFDILAIQEPWKNPFMNTSLSAKKAGFHLLYYDDERTRVCFYVNQRLDPDSWAVEFNGGDFATIHLQTYQGLIHVHNIYNPPPSSHTSNEPGTLPALDQALDKPGQHIAVGDYNLHHPMWGGPGAYTQHNAADLLISIIAEHALQQMVPPDSTTWAARGATSMLDLALLTPEVAGRVTRCAIEPELDHDSDHMPIATVVNMEMKESHPPRDAYGNA